MQTAEWDNRPMAGRQALPPPRIILSSEPCKYHRITELFVQEPKNYNSGGEIAKQTVWPSDIGGYVCVFVFRLHSVVKKYSHSMCGTQKVKIQMCKQMKAKNFPKNSLLIHQSWVYRTSAYAYLFFVFSFLSCNFGSSFQGSQSC